MSDRLLTANLLSLSRAQGDGKGWGMGMGKGGCGDSCCKGEHKTPEGKQSWQASICTTITEAIGLVVTCFCSGTICCHLGCCMCCTVFISGIANLVGSSVPACCKSNKCNNIVFGTTGTISFVIRLIALIIFSASLHQWQSDLDDSDACKSKCGSSASANTPTPAPTTWYEKADYKSCGDVCEEKCFLEECKINREVVKGLWWIIVITGIWMIVSLISLVAGFRACKKEGDAEDLEKAGGGVNAAAVPAQPAVPVGAGEVQMGAVVEQPVEKAGA